MTFSKNRPFSTVSAEGIDTETTSRVETDLKETADSEVALEAGVPKENIELLTKKPLRGRAFRISNRPAHLRSFTRIASSPHLPIIGV
jgi:hypothetical protein